VFSTKQGSHKNKDSDIATRKEEASTPALYRHAEVFSPVMQPPLTFDIQQIGGVSYARSNIRSLRDDPRLALLEN